MIPETTFPSNCLVWVGASILSSLNNEIDRFLLTYAEYQQTNNKIPDRYGEAFLFGCTTSKRNPELYFNKDFEESLRI